jgi:hypothetical protein
MKAINKDFTKLVTSEYISDMAENHIECWKDRYYRKSKQEISFDLNVNHDSSLEIERVEEDLKRKLTIKEETRLLTLFNKAVVKQIY